MQAALYANQQLIDETTRLNATLDELQRSINACEKEKLESAQAQNKKEEALRRLRKELEDVNKIFKSILDL